MRRVRRYTACSQCKCCSLRVEESGRVCRHTIGCGSVERFPLGHLFVAGPLCKGSGEKVLPDIRKKRAA
jgi:hypothetical protein